MVMGNCVTNHITIYYNDVYIYHKPFTFWFA